MTISRRPAGAGQALRAASALAAVLFVGSLAAQELPRSEPADVGMSAERLERLTQVLQDYVEAGRLPGAVTMVLRHGSVAYAEALGHRDREAGDLMELDDIFRIASHTKAMVSVGIMMLQEEGALLISDPVSGYLPAFANTTGGWGL